MIDSINKKARGDVQITNGLSKKEAVKSYDLNTRLQSKSEQGGNQR